MLRQTVARVDQRPKTLPQTAFFNDNFHLPAAVLVSALFNDEKKQRKAGGS